MALNLGPHLIVADTYVQGAEQWTATSWGWQRSIDTGLIDNVDHHASSVRMHTSVSSGHLAIEYVRQHGVAPNGTIIINHTDCDAVVSAAILAGVVPPQDALAAAVLAADHTGAEDRIADALQPLEANRDIDLSLRALQALLSGKSLESEVESKLAARQAERHRWQDRIEEPGTVTWVGSVALLEGMDRIPAELLIALLPRASAVVTAKPEQGGKWTMKVRLGLAAPRGLSLMNIGVERFDAAYGGRWNAGSNTRAGGTLLAPLAYAARLRDAIEAHA